MSKRLFSAMKAKGSDVFAALDVGSNAIRLGIQERKHLGSNRFLTKKRYAVRTGADVFHSSKFGKQTVRDLEQVFLDAKGLCLELGVSWCLAVGTSSFRDSSNAQEVIAHLQKKTDLRLNVISGEVESEFIQKAIELHLDSLPTHCLFVDIGGGSTELKLVSCGLEIFSRSYDVGTVRLMKSAQPIKLLSTFEKEIQRWKSLFELDKLNSPLALIGTGGNFRRLGKLAKIYTSKKNRIKTDSIDRELALSVGEAIQSASIARRKKEMKMRRDRAEVIPFAIDIFFALEKAFSWNELLTPDTGLLNGALLTIEELKNITSRSQHSPESKSSPLILSLLAE